MFSFEKIKWSAHVSKEYDIFDPYAKLDNIHESFKLTKWGPISHCKTMIETSFLEFKFVH